METIGVRLEICPHGHLSILQDLEGKQGEGTPSQTPPGMPALRLWDILLSLTLLEAGGDLVDAVILSTDT